MHFFPSSFPITTDEEAIRCHHPEAQVILISQMIAAIPGNTRTEDIEYCLLRLPIEMTEVESSLKEINRKVPRELLVTVE